MQVSPQNGHLRIVTSQQPDFAFIVNNKEYKCSLNAFLAVSNLGRNYYKFGRLHSPMEINIEDPNNYFADFIDGIQGKPIKINQQNSDFFHKICNILEIQSKINDPNSEKDTEKYNPEKVTKNWSKYKNDEDFRNLSVERIEEIFGTILFEKENGKDVFNWIHDQCERKGSEYRELYKCLDLTELSSPKMQKCVDDISYDEISAGMWEKLKQRLIMPIDRDAEDGEYYEEENRHEEQEEDEEEASIPSETQSSSSSVHFAPQSSVPRTFSNGPILYSGPQKFSNIFQQQQAQEQAKAQAQQQQQSAAHVSTRRAFSTPAETHAIPFFQQHAAQQKNVLELPPNTIRCEYCNENFRGVISTLQDEYPDSWKSFLSVAGGGTKQSKIMQIFNYNDLVGAWWDNYNGRGFSSKDAWLQVNFNGYRLILTHYTIANCARVKNSHQPRKWRVEGSNDGREWVEIHNKNTQQMNIPMPKANFELSKPSQPFSMFRWIMLENNTARSKPNQYEFSVSGLEMFGYLIPM